MKFFIFNVIFLKFFKFKIFYLYNLYKRVLVINALLPFFYLMRLIIKLIIIEANAFAELEIKKKKKLIVITFAIPPLNPKEWRKPDKNNNGNNIVNNVLLLFLKKYTTQKKHVAYIIVKGKD